MRERLAENYRCIFLDSNAMIAESRAQLTAIGADVESELYESKLILSSERPHLAEGQLDIRRVLGTLQSEFDRAMSDGLPALGPPRYELGVGP